MVVFIPQGASSTGEQVTFLPCKDLMSAAKSSHVEHRAKQVTPSMKLSTDSVRGMDAGFRGRQRKDQPTFTGIHGTKSENVAKECAIGFRLVAVEEHVRASNPSHHDGKFISGDTGCHRKTGVVQIS